MRRYEAMLLDVPDPPKVRSLDLSRLDGGLNTWELNYRISANQSPDMENVYWVDGALGSRPGQEYVVEGQSLGVCYCMYERLWSNQVIMHIGSKIYSVDLETKQVTQRYEGVTAKRGTFFVFGSALYYLNGAEYLMIDSGLAIAPVEAYIPTTVVNLKPDGTNGDMYQPENRLSAGKELWYNPDGTSKEYHLPYKDLDDTTVKAEVWGEELTENTDFTVDRVEGTVTFNTAPEEKDILNGVKITIFKENEDALNSIMTCSRAIVYGTGNDMSVIVGGPDAQPNAYFWSGSHSTLDPTYFPMDYYNLAGTADEYITGFGKQQSMLVIFKERSIGKAYFSTETINGRDYLRLSYQPVNTKIGCDLPNTIELVSNNLVFANTEGGVYMLTDTTSANENVIVRLSRNINGTEARPGFLADSQSVSASAVIGYDDGQRYWVTAAGHSYVWDYLISPYNGDESRLSWFYFTNIMPVEWLKTESDTYYARTDGKLVHFTPGVFADFGEAIYRKYQFAAQSLGTYEVLKNVDKVIFVVRSDSNSVLDITWESDYEKRKDLTPIRAYSWRLVPRNLAYRFLGVIKYGQAAVRRPGAFHIRHFSMTLENNEPYTDMSIVSAQIFFQYVGGDR